VIGYSRREERPPLLFVSWGAIAGRSAEIAASLDGQARTYFAPGPHRRPPVLLRYLLASMLTGATLIARRPRVVVVTNPPVPAALVTWFWARLVGAALVLDSHPGGFGAQGDALSGRLQGLHRFVARRSAFCLVADDAWKARLAEWGVDAVVVHEAPDGWDSPVPNPRARLRVLCVGRFAPDEPVGAVLEAARLVPEIDLLLTGDPNACADALRRDAPGNVTFVGFLGPADYHEAVVDADAVLTLTTEPASVMRAAYEAVYARRPLVLSDWPASRALFPAAVHVLHTPEALAEGLSRLAADYPSFQASAESARRSQLARWTEQHGELVRRLRALAPAPDPPG
jgi:glycosyltransferase involved in cell wall biosynthesis